MDDCSKSGLVTSPALALIGPPKISATVSKAEERNECADIDHLFEKTVLL